MTTTSSERAHLVEIPESEVAPKLRARARSAMIRSTHALGMDAVQVRWFRPETDAEREEREQEEKAGRTISRIRQHGNPCGFVMRDMAWINATLPLGEIAVTVAHEVAHVYQAIRQPELKWRHTFPAHLERWIEEDAEAFGRWIAAGY